MFPIVLLLALSGVVVGMLNSLEHFSDAGARAGGLEPRDHRLAGRASRRCSTATTGIYAYAIGVLARHDRPVPAAAAVPARQAAAASTLNFDWRNPHVIRVLKLMLPVTIALGLINFDALINSIFGTLVNDQAPAAIDKAFRIYHAAAGPVLRGDRDDPVPDAVAARRPRRHRRRCAATMANGVRQILLAADPSGGDHDACSRCRSPGSSTSAASSTRAATRPRAEAHVLVGAVAARSAGAACCFSRTFFSLQRPWITDRSRVRRTWS